MKRSMARHESISDKIHRYRGVLLVISIPVVLITFVLYVMPGKSAPDAAVLEEIEITNRKVGTNSRGSRNYAVIFDAGSSGSRVHVYCFDHNLDLVPIGSELELFDQLKPGLSYYAKDPQAAANSLLSLLDKAESVVPQDLRSKTPVRVGATAGLRALEGDAADRILQAVTELLKDKSTLKLEANGVKILDGSQEGSYEWVTINYLLGNLGRTYGDTVGIVDLGGGSVQMAYAISENAASKAPSVLPGEDNYVKEMYLKGSKYYLYVHSYLHYGLLAARAEILKVSDDSGNPCILEGFDGTYAYGGEELKASAPSSGTSMEECRRVTLKALKINDTCTHMKCTYGGVWNGGGGDGQKNLFVASFFFDRAAEVGFIKATDPVAKVQPHSFAEAAKRACQTKYTDAKATPSCPPSYGGPAGGYGGEGLGDARTGSRGGPPGGYDSGYVSGGPRNQGGGYSGPPVDAPAKIKQCDGNCGDSCDNSRIYISNLPPDVTIEELRDLFGGIGQIGRIKQKRGYKDQWPWNIKIYTDEKGNQKGDAVLSYEDPQAAHSAGGFFHNHVLRGYTISVAMAEKTAPKVYDRGGSKGGYGGGGDRRRDNYRDGGSGPDRHHYGGNRSRPY